MLRAVSLGATVQKLIASAIPFIILPSGTMANNGAVTLGTALPAVYASAYGFLPANAIQAGSAAGWYFAQFSSTTVGTVFLNNTYVSGTPTIPAAPIAPASTGPGAFAGFTASQVSAQQITVPAGLLGPNGVLRSTATFSVPSNVNNKTCIVNFGGINFYQNVSTSIQGNQVQTLIYNRSSQAVQIGFASGNSAGLGTTAGADTYSSINTAAAQIYLLAGQLAVATDYIVMESFLVEALPG